MKKTNNSFFKILLAVGLITVLLAQLSACDTEPAGNSSSNSSVSTDDKLGNIEVTEKLESAKELPEYSVDTTNADLNATNKGYAEKEANALREEIKNTDNTTSIYSVSGKKYYISPNGDDSNDGLSPETSLKTVSAVGKIGLNPGDAVLFERGYVYRFKNAIAVKDGITYGSFGEGLKPAIYGSPMNAAKVDWFPSKKKNVWHTDYLYGQPSGLFIDYGKVVGRLKNAGIGTLEKNGDFYHDTASGILYMYCDLGNPANEYESIEISPSTPIFNIPKGTENVVIDNICLKYGAYGIAGGEWTNVSVTNCEFGYIGGMVGESVRRGNAIEIYDGPNKNIKIEHNWVYQTFDSAITWQGRSKKDTVYENISFSDNLLEYNNADFEFWESEGVILKDFKVKNNIMRFTSAGWGTRADDGGIRGIEGCFFGHVNSMNIKGSIEITNNIMDCPAREIIALDARPEQRSSFSIRDNKVYLSKAIRTTNVVLKGFPTANAVSSKISAANVTELREALSIFDSTIKVFWNN